MLYCISFGQTPTEGLVAWYPLNSSATDRSGNGNNGTQYYVTSANDHDGKTGLACHFSGTNSCVAIKPATLDTQFTAITLSAWINPYSFPAYILSKEHYSCTSSDVEFYLDWDTLNVTLGTHHYPFYYDTTFTSLSWVHVAASWDGDTIKAYVNGNLLGSAEFTGGLGWDSLTSYIGKNNATGVYFGGLLDEVRIYNRALDASEIRSLMHYTDTVKFLSLLSPNGGEKFLARQQRNITWVSNQVNNVLIQYSINNGMDWQTACSSCPAGSGKFTWTIPDEFSEQSKIRIFDSADSSFCDVSDSSFIIKDTVTCLNVIALLEGFYDEVTGIMVPDYVYVSLRRAVNPDSIIDYAETYLDSTGYGTASFHQVPDGTYYIVISHRNHIETWSALTYAISHDTTLTLDFSASRSMAYDNNQVQHNNHWCIYGGDVNQDGFVDALDLSAVDQACYYGLSGYIAEDINGNELVDDSDYAIVNRNSRRYVRYKRPPSGQGRIAVLHKWDYRKTKKIPVPVVK